MLSNSTEFNNGVFSKFPTSTMVTKMVPGFNNGGSGARRPNLYTLLRIVKIVQISAQKVMVYEKLRFTALVRLRWALARLWFSFGTLLINSE